VRTSRHTTSVLLAGGLLVGLAGPAAADPAGPTNYRSVVTGIDPATDAVSVDVLGGDAFVAVTAAPGATVTVEGYEDEPYLRFLPDGTVERNEASPARWLNDARYGAMDVTVPPEASAEAPPRWEPVADGGTYAWHDHRVHWMSPEVPDQVDQSAGTPQGVATWELELTADDQPVVVSGELDWLPSPSPVPAVIVVLAVVAVGIVLVRRWPATAPAIGLVGALAAGTVGVAGTVGRPPGADADPALLILPAIAAVLALAAVALRRREGIGGPLVGALVGLPVLVWSILQLRALVSPIVPTVLPDLTARLLVAVALGVGIVSLVAAAAVLLRGSPALVPGDPATA
jgi:hypothetical protein